MTEVSRAAAIQGVLIDAGWKPIDECNEDGYKLEGETNEGKTAVCVLDLALKMPKPLEGIDDDLDSILLHIEEAQRSVSAAAESDPEKCEPEGTCCARQTPVSVTKQFRKDLDATLQRLKFESDTNRDRFENDTYRSSRERSLAITKIQEAIMWLGMDLKAQSEEMNAIGGEGEPNPYPESYNPDSPVIEKTADGLKL